MRASRWGILAALIAACAACAAEDEYPIYVYPCPEAEVPPRVDGVLDDLAWESAPLVGGFTLYDRPTRVEVQTFLRATWDARALYLAVQCDEPLIDRLAPKAAPRDATQIFADEAIEIFVDPDHDHTRYYQFGINAAGSLFDGERHNTTWNSNAEVATSVRDEAWFIEVSIPWSDLAHERRRAGAVVGLNVCRDRHLSGVREWTNWSQTQANFHDPERFAHLVLSPTPQQLGALGPEFRKGDRAGPIRVFSSEGFAQTTYAELTRQAFAQLDGLIAELEDQQREERDRRTARLLGEVIERQRGAVAGLRAEVEGVESVDAALWSRMDLGAQRLLRELENGLWEARLHALLSGI